MNLLQKIANAILGKNNIQHPTSSPNSLRYSFLSGEQENRKRTVEEYKAWYYGSSEDLIEYFAGYNATASTGIVSSLNKRQYFWAISTNEINIKRTHSGVPNAIISTIVNIIGEPKIKSDNDIEKALFIKLFEDLEIGDLINQEQLPLTLVTGRGAFKPDFDIELSDKPIWKFYDDLAYEPIREKGVLVGMIFKDFYIKNNTNYVLTDSRYVKRDKVTNSWSSHIDYKLFVLDKNNELTETTLDQLEETNGLENVVIPNVKDIFGVESRFFIDPINRNNGRSIFNGKCDLFDDLDQVLSQSSQTVRVSTPVEYYPSSVLSRDKNGKSFLPSVYNRQFLKVENMPDGDGRLSSEIQTTQPELNFDKYNLEAMNILNFILTGILSPATLGIDIAKKDNADAQREKEKVSIFTAFNIKTRQKRIIKKVLKLSAMLSEYLATGQITIKDYNISIDFDDFASPTFESQLKLLSDAWANGSISTKKYVDLLWGDSLTEDDKKQEVEYLEIQRASDNIDFSSLENENANESA